MKAIILSILLVLAITSPVHSIDITVGWDANSETDLAGYRLYRGSDSRDDGGYQKDPAYRIGDIPAGTETYTWTNVPDGPHYFSLTAYDESDNESGFSNEVFTVAPEYPAPKKQQSPTVLDIN